MHCAVWQPLCASKRRPSMFQRHALEHDQNFYHPITMHILRSSYFIQSPCRCTHVITDQADIGLRQCPAKARTPRTPRHRVCSGRPYRTSVFLFFLRHPYRTYGATSRQTPHNRPPAGERMLNMQRRRFLSVYILSISGSVSWVGDG